MIEVSHLTKKYGSRLAVDDISFTVEDGVIYGLLGPNGAGKSTIMNILTGYLAATEGQVTVAGHPLPEEADAAKARARAMELLAGQELSSGQLYERLGRKFTQPTAAAVVAEMVERQYVDDERYARTRAHGLLAARKSRRAAAQNLRQKGLDAQQISAALEEVYAPDEAGGDPELEAAAALVEGRYRGKLAAGRKDLVVAALARRGFAYPIIKEAIKRVEEEN